MIQTVISLMPPFLKAVLGVIAFMISLGWAAAIAIQLTVRTEVAQAKSEMRSVREADMEHINKRLDVHNNKLDYITRILLERR